MYSQSRGRPLAQKVPKTPFINWVIQFNQSIIHDDRHPQASKSEQERGGTFGIHLIDTQKSKDDQQQGSTANATTTMAPPPRRRRQLNLYRIQIPILSRFFPNQTISIPRFLSPTFLFQCFASSALYVLGPILILVTVGLLVSLSWTFWCIIIPLKFHSYTSFYAVVNQLFVGFVLFNIVYNYISCVTTKHFNTHDYERVVRELARATGFHYPESQEEMDRWRMDWREMILERSRQKRLALRYQLMSKYGLDEEHSSLTADTSIINTSTSTSTSTTLDGNNSSENRDTGTNANACTNTVTTKQSDSLTNRKREKTSHPRMHAQPMGRSWMWLGPNEWSYCERTNLPKPPRSHYDHVTKSLVMNMDHYCPVSYI